MNAARSHNETERYQQDIKLPSLYRTFNVHLISIKKSLKFCNQMMCKKKQRLTSFTKPGKLKLQCIVHLRHPTDYFFFKFLFYIVSPLFFLFISHLLPYLTIAFWHPMQARPFQHPTHLTHFFLISNQMSSFPQRSY